MKTAFQSVVALAGLFTSLAQAHTAITYPGWRGDNLVTNETYPFGMQWNYPCGGLGLTQNRTYWPLNGDGTIAVQPGFMRGHESALMYINMGLGEKPVNYTTIVVPRFHLTGPSNRAYNGTFCLPGIRMPPGLDIKEGDMATIQVVEAATHGAGLFNCVDIIFTDDDSKIPPVNGSNCFNTTGLKIDAADIALESTSIIRNASLVTPAESESESESPTSTSGGARMLAPVSGLIALLLLI